MGKDEFASLQEKVASKDGMRANYLRVDGFPTGKCAVLVVDGERSLVASLGAAEQYKVCLSNRCSFTGFVHTDVHAIVCAHADGARGRELAGGGGSARVLHQQFLHDPFPRGHHARRQA